MKTTIRYSTIKVTISAVILAALIALDQTTAQGGFGGLGGLGGIIPGNKKADSSSATVDMGSFGQSADDVIGKVLAARITFMDAKAKIMEAMGLKNDAAIKASEALRAVEGSTSSADKVAALNTSVETTKEADQQMKDSLSQSTEISAESKVKYAEGTGKFIEGVLQEKAQIETTQKLVEQGQSLAQTASPLEKVKVLGVIKPITTLAGILPGDIKEGTSTLSKIMEFAKKQNITAIPNADKATAGLGDL